MRKIKKLTALMLAVVMALAMSLTAFATETKTETTAGNGNFNITLTGKQEGHVYGAYQVFTGDLLEEKDAEGKVTKKVLSNIQWGGATASKSADIIEALKASGAPFNTLPEDAKASDVAKVLENGGSSVAETFAKVVAPHLTNTLSKSQGSTKDENGNYTYVIPNLKAGYYLVRDTEAVNETDDAYTSYIMQVVSNVDATVKSDVPDIDKIIVNADSNEDGNDKNNGKGTAVNVGDEITFKLETAVPKMEGYETYDYIVHDVMSKGLTFVEGSVTVALESVENFSDTGVTFTQKPIETTEKEESKLTIEFSNFINLKNYAGKKLTISYKAILNNNALVTDVEKNKVQLEYSNNPNDTGHGKTTEKEVYVYDFDIVIDKVDSKDSKKLSGAEFTLTNKDGKYYSWDETNKKVVWSDTQVICTTDENGGFNFKGLDSGEYVLTETKAPAGYNVLENPINITIQAVYTDTGEIDGTQSKVIVNRNDGEDSTETAITKIQNQYGHTCEIGNSSGSLLPSTGGIGTTIFYIVGAILVIGAGVILVVKKRMSNE